MYIKHILSLNDLKILKPVQNSRNLLFQVLLLFKAEKEAASSIPPLRDLSEASTVENDATGDTTSVEQNADAPIRIFKWDKDALQLCQQCKLVST